MHTISFSNAFHLNKNLIPINDDQICKHFEVLLIKVTNPRVEQLSTKYALMHQVAYITSKKTDFFRPEGRPRNPRGMGTGRGKRGVGWEGKRQGEEGGVMGGDGEREREWEDGWEVEGGARGKMGKLAPTAILEVGA
jgi:hypothetical protein